MYQIAVLTNAPEAFAALADGLCADSRCNITWLDSVPSVPAAVVEASPDLLIIDEAVDGQSGLAIARQIIRVNAMVNLAVVSSLSSEAFHEAAEGLGIMVHLPPHSGGQQADTLLAALAKIVCG
jgi:DNA-binding response OmpR family regulator